MKSTALCAFSLLLCTCPAAIPLRWTVETSRAVPAQFEAYQGETLELEAALKSYGTPLEAPAQYSLYWQTNGMGNAWWEAPCAGSAAPTNVLFATWSPTNDVGAKVYNCFVGRPGAIYHAAFQLRLRPSPGATPSVLEPPVKVLDFAAVEVRNAPYFGKAETAGLVAAATNGLETAEHAAAAYQPKGAYLTAEADPTVPAWAKAAQKPAYTAAEVGARPAGWTPSWGDVADKPQFAAVATSGAYGDLSGRPEIPGTNGFVTASITNGLAHLADLPGTNGFVTASITNGLETAEHAAAAYQPKGAYLTAEADPTVPAWAKAAQKPAYTAAEVGARPADWTPGWGDVTGKPQFAAVATSGSYADLSGKPDIPGTNGFVTASITNGLARLADLPSTNGFVTASVTNGLMSAAAIEEMREGMAELNEGYARLYGFATGSTNANFTVTNYPATRAEAEARFRFEPEDGMDFSDVPASLRLNENRDGEWRTVVDVRDWTAWYFRWREIRLTNEIARLTAENAALSARLEASMAWGGRTANGVENPLEDTVVVDRANTWLMADCEWQKFASGSNSCWVLRSKNAALSAGGNTNGFLEIRDAFGKAHVRINKTADAFADPVPSSIRWDRDEDAWYVAFSDTVKPTRGGANCELEGSGRKAVLYAEDDPDCPATITWPDVPESGPGNWIMKAVPKTVGGVKPTTMFFGAEIAVPGVEYVEFLSEAAFGGGIRVGNNVYEPRESGGTLTWEKRQ